ncbi:YicC/YloC family endoribonuclease [Ureibacillus sp. FSL K6-8385]|uniref:YicC family protein n=1 Tax=Ureibacillus terrenus TaxID=118246 RepID=A0A540V4D4_9BACL|nr:YicC/YloC family endoribonuclease [Ureibacillus terrenus]MED3660345.1 YicC family protein [Ureibacillus terrenus]MED3762501.1 YicC family protein [Ureibacillus terrenus]TQE91568.1 YicC family protein [Ureibacillus terrenus]
MVRSMTGFGRGVTTTNDYQLTVEIRSVNHRFLEIYTKFPKEWLELELVAKKIISQYVKRGKFDCLINLKLTGEEVKDFKINWPLIEAYKNAKNELRQVLPMDEQYSMQEVLSLEGALIYEKKELTPEELASSMEQAVREAMEKLVEMRKREGQELKQVLLQYNEELKQQVKFIRDHSQDAVKKYREKLKERLAEIVNAEELDDRILAEVALFAERIDISEELDRLESHFQQLKETLEEENSIGRKLDFLMQEMLREINTIGSKNQSVIISPVVVQSKTILEKMREQVQNIE